MDDAIPTDMSASGMQPDANGSFKPELKPSLLDAFQAKPIVPSFGLQSPLESTPGISGDINDKLVLGSTSEETDDEDSLLDTESVRSEEDEMPFYGLPLRALPTGLCYDDRMRYHAEVASTSENSLHPEDPRRIFYIFKELSDAGLVADPKHPRPLVPQPLLRIDAREATESECCLVHTPDHYAFVRATAGMSLQEFGRDHSTKLFTS
jgi:histone deacetylase 6